MFNSNAVTPININMGSSESQFQVSERQSQYDNLYQNQFQNYQNEMDEIIKQNLHQVDNNREQVCLKTFIFKLGSK